MTLERVEVHLATVIMPQTPAPIHLTGTMTAAAPSHWRVVQPKNGQSYTG
jgi:hypothetical protein